MDAALQILMKELIDYAGLFPPASLDMSAAVRNYAAYLKSPQAPWLGRFVLPVARLQEFSRAFAGLVPDGKAQAGKTQIGKTPGGESSLPEWRLSVLIGNDLASDLEAIAAFNRSSKIPGARKAAIDSLEMKTDSAEAIRNAMAMMPSSLTAYFEISIQEDPAPLIAVIAKSGGRAKVRTGGVTDALFPTPGTLARFLTACARAGVPFKATAGLHHPIRSQRPMTYAPDSAQTVMHGFLNVFLAAAFALIGMDPETITALLREESPQAFAFRDGEVVWRGHRLEASKLLDARRTFALGFGSCAFEEPFTDMLEAKIL